jgi:hypothetical protein
MKLHAKEPWMLEQDENNLILLLAIVGSKEIKMRLGDRALLVSYETKIQLLPYFPYFFTFLFD